MKRNPGKKRKQQLIQVWSYDQTIKALPYLLEVIRSLRENYLAMQFANHRLNKISQRKERPALRLVLFGRFAMLGLDIHHALSLALNSSGVRQTLRATAPNSRSAAPPMAIRRPKRRWLVQSSQDLKQRSH